MKMKVSVKKEVKKMKKWYQIFAMTDKAFDVAVVQGKNRYEAIVEARKRCLHSKYVPLVVKQISQKYAGFMEDILDRESVLNTDASKEN